MCVALSPAYYGMFFFSFFKLIFIIVIPYMGERIFRYEIERHACIIMAIGIR